MQNQASLQETKQHGAVRFPFNLYPCTIPGDFPQVALHWQESMELVFVKRGAGCALPGPHGGHLRLYARHPPRPAADGGTVHGIRESYF